MEIRGLGMTYKKFYCGKLDAPVLEHIDAAHKKEMKRLIEAIHQGAWTEKQKKRQKSSILSNIALYKSLTGQKLSKNEEGAYVLVADHEIHSQRVLVDQERRRAGADQFKNIFRRKYLLKRLNY